MEPIVDMRVSRMGPIVEGNLVELVDMVKQIGRQKGTDLTESQNRKMVGYLGNLDEMRQQIVIMVQRYEEDSKVLKRLLDLLDRIDDVKDLALHSNEIENENDTVIDASDKEIAKQYDTPFNPLMVSTLNILDVSGLFATNINDDDLEEEDDDEEEIGDEYWDHEDDLANLAPHDDTPKEVSSINLSVSSLDLPDLYPSPLLQQINDIKGKSKLSSSCSDLEPRKNKGKQPIRESTFSSIKGKGKGKAPVDSSDGYSSDGSDLSQKDSGEESEEESGPNGASSSQPPPPPRSSWRHGIRPGAAFAVKPLAQRRAIESSSDSSASYIGSSESSSSESEIANSSRNRNRRNRHSHNNINNNNSSIPVPPPMPPSKRTKKKGPCDPVLCKICYDEYNMLEHIWEFKECKHVYCRECLQDYLTTNINDGAVLDLTCPFPDCDTEVLPSHIKALCSAETMSKFERFTVLAALRADPNARWCPNPECNNGIKYNAATMPWVNCNACKFEFCFHCLADRHDGVPCGPEALAFVKKKKESEALAMEKFNEFAATMKAFVKPCPSCNTFIEKNDGCNHMTCGNRSCGAQFCWLCLSLYTDTHFADSVEFPDCYDRQYWTPPELMDDLRPTAYQQQRRTRRFASVAKKVGIFVGVGVAVVTLGVPAAVIGGPVYGCFKLHKRLKARRNRNYYPNTHDYNFNYDPNFVPPSPERIAEAAREARRLYLLEHS